MINSDLDKKCRSFRKKLLKWHLNQNRRQMPWKGEKDPYRIWLSEIILQQTRVEQGWAYYERFLQQFPTIQQLAKAPDEQVMKCWEGLGYYSRCRNLIHTARYIAFERGGQFPDQYETILTLKGVGPYTAAAISSFAFNLPHAVVDGNVYRVLSRYHGLKTPIDTSAGKKLFQDLAQRSLDVDQPGIYNQALMDFGATVCKPQSPLCASCPLQSSCLAYAQDWVDRLPVKSPAKAKKKRWFIYLVPTWRGKIPVHMRTGSDVWSGLWEPPLIESKKFLDLKTMLKQIRIDYPATWPRAASHYSLHTYKQQLSHQEINGQFISTELDIKPNWGPAFRWVNRGELAELAFPKMIQDHWKALGLNG